MKCNQCQNAAAHDSNGLHFCAEHFEFYVTQKLTKQFKVFSPGERYAIFYNGQQTALCKLLAAMHSYYDKMVVDLMKQIVLLVPNSFENQICQFELEVQAVESDDINHLLKTAQRLKCSILFLLDSAEQLSLNFIKNAMTSGTFQQNDYEVPNFLTETMYDVQHTDVVFTKFQLRQQIRSKIALCRVFRNFSDEMIGQQQSYGEFDATLQSWRQILSVQEKLVV